MSLPKHHAFVAYGSPSKLKEFSAYMAKELGVTAAGNPDFHIRDYSREGSEDTAAFGVEEAQALTALAAKRGVGDKKAFIIGANSLTREGQNALLKTLEEPTEETVFAFLVPHGALIDTVRSRVIELPWHAQKVDDTLAETFLGSTPEKRSQLIAGILKDKDKEAARELFDALERLLVPHIQKVSVHRALAELSQMRSFVSDRSPSLKMILEHMALSMPIIR